MWDDPRELNLLAGAIAAMSLVLVMVCVGNWAVRQPAFAFRHVVIGGTLTRANAAHLEAVIREELRGTFFTMNLVKARESLQRVPWVRKVALRREWPGQLAVLVTEHEPLARWNETGL